MKLRILSLLALTMAGLGLVAFVSPSTPAWACSCAARDQDERADLIVVGTVTDVSDSAVRLAVESVEKGAGAAGSLRLKVQPVEASCGYAFRTGGRYRVNSINGATGLCVGVSPLPARPPTPTATPTLTAATATATAAPAESTRGWWIAAGTTMAALAAGLAAVAWRRRRAT